MSSPALTLIIEDELRKLVHGDRMFKHTEKLAGLLPRGSDSPFGDFPCTKNTKRCDRDNVLIQPRRVRVAGNGIPPPRSGIYGRAPIQATHFRQFYIRGDLPIQIQHGTANRVGWKCEISSLDYSHYIPIFLEGIREKEDPFRFLAVQGTYDMLSVADEQKLLPVIPLAIAPIKQALTTRDREVVATVCKILQTMVSLDRGGQAIGKALVPFYRHILPVMGVFKASNNNLGDAFDFSQRKRLCLGDLIHETLQLLGETGGTNATDCIKYIIPSYESVMGVDEG